MDKRPMKISLVISSILGLLIAGHAMADSKTLASTMDVYVFPKEGQTATDQSKAEAECYEWAAENTGTDPFEQSKELEKARQAAEQQSQQAQQASQGAGAKGAVRGAAVGALIGEIADDDASEGAAWGAAAGMMSSRRRARANTRAAQQQGKNTVEQAQRSTAAETENFKKAFSVCLEAKDYMVKY